MKLSRRSLLKKAGILSLPLFVGSFQNIFSQSITSSPSSARKTLSSRILDNTAIVLGGGLAGLYSAYLLKKNGVKVRIVESSPRLGGRILSFQDPASGQIADLGGEWIGESQTLIRKIAKDFELKLVAPNWNQIRALWDPNRLSEKSRGSLEKLVTFQSKIPENQIEGLDKISLFRYLKYQGFSEGELEDLDRVVKVFFGESSRNISSHFLLNCIDSKKSYFQNLAKFEMGAESLIKKLTAEFSPDEIILSDGAVKVSQSKSGVQLELASGLVLRSKHLICTVPSYAVSDIEWAPALPREKVFALLRIGYGKIHKELIKVETSPLSPQETSGVVDWVFPNEKNFITAISSEGRAAALERSPNDVTKEILLRSIQQFQPSSIPSLGVERHGFGRGAVSLYTPGTYGIKDSIESSFGKVHFAGEHLGEIPGTMEAALSSAVRAVRKI